MRLGVIGDVVPVVKTLDCAVLTRIGDGRGKAVESWSTWVTNGTTSAATTATKPITKPRKTSVAAGRRPSAAPTGRPAG